MGETKQIATKVDEESTLYQEFVRFEEERGYHSRSEAVRALMRESLDPGGENGDQIEHQLHQSRVRPVVSEKEGWEAIFEKSMDYFMRYSALFAVSVFVFFLDYWGVLPTPSVIAEGFVVIAFFLFVPTLLFTAGSWIALQTRDFSDDLAEAVDEAGGVEQ